MDFITSDRTLQVGDLVFSSYHKKDLLFKITQIERRFLTQHDLTYGRYANASIGDEYNPVVTIKSVANLSISYIFKKKFRPTGASIDASWVKRAEPEHIQAYIKKLNELLTEFWP